MTSYVHSSYTTGPTTLAAGSVHSLPFAIEKAAVDAGKALYVDSQSRALSVLQDGGGRIAGLIDGDGSVAMFPNWSVDASGDMLGMTGPDASVYALSEVTPYVTRTTTGTAFTGPCELAGYDCTVAAGNITIYDNTSAAGTVIVPTTALSVGRVEFQWKRALTNGCHVVLSGAATVNVLVG